ncbi:MAG: HAD-IA family hydrolase [Lachnospiraceae bacterium]|nr:HAD-IA family hydrolase [Lachnospiraceae bacterium]
MEGNFFSYSFSQQGHSHLKTEKPCEDSSGSFDGEGLHISIVADGHGSDNYPRAKKGSLFAVDAGMECVKKFVRDAAPERLLEDGGKTLLTQLAKSILLSWHTKLEADCRAYPFTEKELAKVDLKHRKRYLSENPSERRIGEAYGTTLIVFAVTPAYSFGLQIGDGKCVVVDKKGCFQEPIPWDENCQLNITTSLCDKNAIDEFRYFASAKAPAAVFCGTDGVDDSYVNGEELHALYRSIMLIFAEHGIEVGEREIQEYLPVLTRKGSGDDVSIALIMNMEQVKRISMELKNQAEAFKNKNGKAEKAEKASSPKSLRNNYQTAVFDLDGTLLDTIQDLKNSVNYALRRIEAPERSLAEVLEFVGNGIKNLMHRSVPLGTDPIKEERAFFYFKEHYLLHCEDKTVPYPGILELLDRLKKRGFQTAIVSNKNDVPVKKLSAKYFGQLIDVAIGENEAAGIAKKPAPDTVFKALKELGADASRSVYIGDSEVDYSTARNAGLPVVLVSWGFRKREKLQGLHPDFLADSVQELEGILCGLTD